MVVHGTLRCGLLAALCMGGAGCAQILGLSGDYREREDDGPDAGTELALPPGKLVYHRFSDYWAGDSEMFVVSLPGGETSAELGAIYGLCHPLNGIFSPDGTHLVVMAMPRAEPCPATDRALMDVYELDLTRQGEKVQVTANDVPDEDPQYFADGKRLVFKHDGHIAEWSVGSAQFTGCDALPAGAACYGGSGEQSKPVVTPDGSTVCYYESQLEAADIYCFDRVAGLGGASLDDIREPAVVHKDIFDARPSLADSWLYYVRWRSVTNRVGYVARKALDDFSGVGEEAAFSDDEGSDYLDPFGLPDDLVLFSSNQAGRGGYDLFVARFDEPEVISLDRYVPELNSPKFDLGAAYWVAP